MTPLLGRRAWVLCALALAAACVEAGDSVASNSLGAAALDEVTGLTDDFIRELAADDFEAAYERMSEPYRSAVTLERFQRGTEGNPYFAGAHRIFIHSTTTIGGDAAEARGVLASDAGRIGLTASASRVDERWAITGLNLGGLPAIPVPGIPAATTD